MKLMVTCSPIFKSNADLTSFVQSTLGGLLLTLVLRDKK